jgi:mannose/fructose/N-acetylgalactosamine-specific phosphotransferase system component IIC
MLLEILLVSFFGVAIGLDRTQLIQSMVSRPIVCGPLLGILLGNPQMGAAIGAPLEFIWRSWLPVGGVVPPNDSLITVLAVGGACLVPGSEAHLFPVAGFFILLTLPLAPASRRMEIFIRRANVWLSHRADRQAADPSMATKVGKLNLAGIGFAAVVLVIFLVPTTMLVVYGGTWAYRLLPSDTELPLTVAYFIVVGITAGALLSNRPVKKRNDLLAGAFIVGAAVAILFTIFL